MGAEASHPDGGSTGLRLCLLGPVQILVDDRPVPLGGPGIRGLLAMLLLEPNQVVSLDRIVDVLWAHEPPASARTMVQGYVSRLRQRLAFADPSGWVRIVTNPPGYQLVVDEDLIDVTIARRLLAQARDEPVARRAELLRAAQNLWRGPELADVGERVPAPALAELRLAVLEAKVDADLELGRHDQVIGELTELVREHPFREHLIGQLMLALYRSGRRAAALEVYQRFAQRALDVLGLDPGPQLRTLHARVLRDDSDLLEPRGDSVVTPRIGVLVPAQLPSMPSGFSGREEELAWLDALVSDVDSSATAVGVIAGPAGIGKTALVVLWGHRAMARFPDGQLFASMRGFDPQHASLDPADVLTQFLLALGVGLDDVPLEVDDRAALYRSLLAERRVIVVLDDARDSEQIRPLLPGGSSSPVLVTTRVRLDGLVASSGARTLVLGTLPVDAAERLIEQTAGPTKQDSHRTLRRRLAELCGHLPLALRIVGARLSASPQWSVADLVDELADERSRLGALDLEDADTSVRAALDVTYRSLRPDLAATVRMLGLFPGPRIGPYAVAALSASDLADARRRLRSLAASFVVSETSRDIFVMHDLVRLHARELADIELSEVDRSAAKQRLLRYYLVNAERARHHLRAGEDNGELDENHGSGPRPPMDSAHEALAWIEQEWPNVLAVVEAGLEEGAGEDVVRLARMASDFSQGTRAFGGLVLGGATWVAV